MTDTGPTSSTVTKTTAESIILPAPAWLDLNKWLLILIAMVFVVEVIARYNGIALGDIVAMGGPVQGAFMALMDRSKAS